MVRFPEDYPTYRVSDTQSPETKRILEQINRVNINLGYIKKRPHSQPRVPNGGPPYQGQNVFQSYYQGNNNYVPSIRRSSDQVARKIEQPKVVLVPDFVELQTYIYPGRMLKSISLLEALKVFEPELSKEQEENDIKKRSRTSANKKALVSKLKKIQNGKKREILEAVSQSLSESGSLNDKSTDKLNIILVTLKPKVKKTRRTSRSEKQVKKSKARRTKPKTIFSPRPRPISSNSIASALSKVPTVTTQPGVRQENTNKGPLAAFLNRPNEAVEAIREGGVIIQRLRVRNGGIAIAGPNGIATAGSGGTAIVGPGGTAITHPKGLSIAGPGARVISVPETMDLRELALRTMPGEVPINGTVVAHGPAIYYNHPEKTTK